MYAIVSSGYIIYAELLIDNLNMKLLAIKLLALAHTATTTAIANDDNNNPISGSGLRVATNKKKVSTLSAAPFTLSETCGVGTYKCYGEGSVGGDYQGPDRIFSIDNEFADVKYLEDFRG